MATASTPSRAVATYLRTVRQLRATGQNTPGLSFYPALFRLLDDLIQGQTPAKRTLPQPAGIDGDFPDVAIYELHANVPVLPVEVKGAGASIEELTASRQAERYARSFGGGQVLLTNLREFVLARVAEGGRLAVDAHVALAAGEDALSGPVPTDLGNAPDALALVLAQACQVRGTLSDPTQVAAFLAYHAREMRDSINGSRRATTLLAPLHHAFETGLGIDVPTDLLVPTVVQTLVYGLFAAWLDVNDPQDFDWMDSAYELKVPVFAEVLHAALSPGLVTRARLHHHLDAVARALMWVDREPFVSRFDGDAIEYFYEPFLAEFDKDLRNRLGVWYTPREIAEYQVARCDHHLGTDLGIADGIADPTVLLLDPACGTGTYLAAIVRRIYAHHRANNEPHEVAATRTREAAVTRVVGFEILPAAFIVCHLHLARLLAKLEASPLEDERIRVYLTNSLIGWGADASPPETSLFPELEEELQDSSRVKRHEPVLVVLGNPPYQGYSRAETVEEQRMLTPWVEPLWPVWGLRKHRLNDLYIRFWRVAIERIAVLTGRGVVSFITNRKWLGGRSYPTMREAVINAFGSVVVDDLHGAPDDTSHPGDQSVFTTKVAAGITRGTAIVTAVRRGPADEEEPAPVRARELWGTSEAKRQRLVGWAGSDIDAGLRPVTTTAKSRWRFTTDIGGDHPNVDEYLTFYRSGVQPVRDEAVMAFDREILEQRMWDYFNPDLSFEALVARHPGFEVKRARYDPARTRRRLLSSSAFDQARLVPFLYRPFDLRWLYWEPDHKLLNEPRRELLPYWLAVPNQRCLVLPQTPRRPGAFRPVASRAVASFACAEPDARLFPLLGPGDILHGADGQLGNGSEHRATARLLVAPEWVEAAATLDPTDNPAAAEAVFMALLALMNSPAWLADQPVDADDFPPVPLPGDGDAMRRAAQLGREIAALDDPSTEVPGVTTGSIDGRWAAIGVPDSVAGRVAIENGRRGSNGGQRKGTAVLWNTNHGWRSLPDDVWSFTACGHAVLPKWLSYRKETGLTSADRETFMLLCRRIAALRALEPELDRLYREAQSNPLSITAEES